MTRLLNSKPRCLTKPITLQMKLKVDPQLRTTNYEANVNRPFGEFRYILTLDLLIALSKDYELHDVFCPAHARWMTTLLNPQSHCVTKPISDEA